MFSLIVAAAIQICVSQTFFVNDVMVRHEMSCIPVTMEECKEALPGLLVGMADELNRISEGKAEATSNDDTVFLKNIKGQDVRIVHQCVGIRES